jgi:hypothetical protein
MACLILTHMRFLHLRRICIPMEPSTENLEAYRMALWRLKCATIAAAIARGWPGSRGVDTPEYRDCHARLEEAREALGKFPAEWSEMPDLLCAG